MNKGVELQYTPYLKLNKYLARLKFPSTTAPAVYSNATAETGKKPFRLKYSVWRFCKRQRKFHKRTYLQCTKAVRDPRHMEGMGEAGLQQEISGRYRIY